MSADDFLPVLTFVIIQAAPANLMEVAELCSHLLDPDEAIAERGYYVASLQAAVNIALNLQVEGVGDGTDDEEAASPGARRSSYQRWLMKSP